MLTTVLLYQCNISYYFFFCLFFVFPVSFAHWRICVIPSMTTCHALHNLASFIQRQWKRIWHSLNSHHAKRSGIFFAVCTYEKPDCDERMWWKIHISRRIDRDREWQRKSVTGRKSRRRTETETEKWQKCTEVRHSFQSRKCVLFVQKVRLKAFYILSFAAGTRLTKLHCSFWPSCFVFPNKPTLNVKAAHDKQEFNCVSLLLWCTNTETHNTSKCSSELRTWHGGRNSFQRFKQVRS